jgi:hypothetical protein
MFRAFNLTNCSWSEISADEGTTLNESHRRIVKAALQQFVANGKLDGTKMRSHWFPEIRADVFISHSHRDVTDATKLAGYLKRNFGLDSFIDSCVWGCADDLLKQIDDQYCLNAERETYSYYKRNGSTSHVHIMLSTALGTMLDAAECVIFMNTPSSITSNDAVSKTLSPWIYYELGLLNIIRPRPAKRLRLENFAKRAFANLPIEYSVDLGNLVVLNADTLQSWLQARRDPRDAAVHSLDLLYEAVPEKPNTR